MYGQPPFVMNARCGAEVKFSRTRGPAVVEIRKVEEMAFRDFAMAARRERRLDARIAFARGRHPRVKPARDAEIVERFRQPAELLVVLRTLDVEARLHGRVADRDEAIDRRAMPPDPDRSRGCVRPDRG